MAILSALVASYVPIAFANLSGTVSISATASPGTTVISTLIPALPLYAVDVVVTDVDLANSSASPATAFLQIFVSGFGLKSPIYANLGHTADAGVVNLPANGGEFFGAVHWYLPQGGAGVNIQAGGTIGLAVYASAANVVTVGASYMIVYGLFGGVV